MDIDFYRPCERLRPFIRYYWVMKTGETHDILTFPIGCPQLIFHRLNRFYIPELNSVQARFTISGQVNFPARIQSSGNAETIVAVFYPHAIGTIFNVPVSEFYNHEIDGYSLGDKKLNVLSNDVLNADNSGIAVKMIEEYLLSRLDETGLYNFYRLDAPLREFLHDTSINVEEMANLSCLSRKQFERVFYNSVGMKPKEYSKIARFQKSLWMMQKGARDYAQIAYSCGYSDQSHFIRECRRYSGLTPSELLKIQSIYSDLFTSPV